MHNRIEGAAGRVWTTAVGAPPTGSEAVGEAELLLDRLLRGVGSGGGGGGDAGDDVLERVDERLWRSWAAQKAAAAGRGGRASLGDQRLTPPLTSHERTLITSGSGRTGDVRRRDLHPRRRHHAQIDCRRRPTAAGKHQAEREELRVK